MSAVFLPTGVGRVWYRAMLLLNSSATSWVTGYSIAAPACYCISLGDDGTLLVSMLIEEAPTELAGCIVSLGGGGVLDPLELRFFI